MDILLLDEDIWSEMLLVVFKTYSKLIIGKVRFISVGKNTMFILKTLIAE